MTRPTTTIYIATSLDGFIARPDGAIDWLGQPVEGEDYGWAEFIATIDAIVMGRVTFEQVLEFGEWPYEGTPLIVLSTTMKAVPEHLVSKVEISSSAPSDLLQELAERGCRRVYIDGGKTLQSFLRDDLLDELVLNTIPVLIGQGLPCFGPLDADLEWEHHSTRVSPKGLVMSRYRRRL